MIDEFIPSRPCSPLHVGLLVACLVAPAGCQSDRSPTDPSSDDRAAPSPQSAPQTRTRRQRVDLDDGKADSFQIDVDLSEISAFQIDQGSTRLETDGHLHLAPGYKFESTIDLNRPEGRDREVEVPDDPVDFRVEYNVFDELDVKLTTDLQVDTSTNGGITPVDRTVTLCEPESDCSPSIDVHGVTYDIVPKARLKVAAEVETPGSVRFGFEDRSSRHYLKGGVEFDHQTGWHRQRRHDFAIEPGAPEVSETFEGNIEVRFELIYDLRLRTTDSTVASIHLMQSTDSLDARVQPPECYASRTVKVGGELYRSPDNANPYCLGGNGKNSCLTAQPLYERTLHEGTYQFQDQRSACETSSGDSSPDESPQRCSPGSNKSCPIASQICMLGRCVTDAPLQIALRWRAPVDLDLVVHDDDGNRLKPLEDGDRNQLDGWMAATAAGTHDDPMGYVEIANLRSAEANKPLRFRVETADGSAVDDRTPYTLFVHARGQFETPREITGHLEGTGSSATYEFRSDRYVHPE